MSQPGLLSKSDIKAIIPKPLLPAAKQLYRFALNQYHGVRLARQKRIYRQRYGNDFVTIIHNDDEMLKYPRDFLGMVPHRAATRYFAIGETILNDLYRILSDLEYTITARTRILEFASGYGKVTRFLITRMKPDQLTVSDIDQQAVDFNSRTFGTAGFYSVTDPDTLRHSETYDLIFVVSLFTHLPSGTWGAWLKKLYSMLRPGGLLIFSTHNTSIYESIDAATRERLTKAVEPGFYYLGANETFGRLSLNEYGATYVTHDFVTQFIKSAGLGHVRRFYPKAIDSYQDVFVIERPSA